MRLNIDSFLHFRLSLSPPSFPCTHCRLFTTPSTENDRSLKIHATRGFSSPLNVTIRDGECQISSNNAIGAVLSLDLVHSIDPDWAQMKDVKFFLYEIVGHYSSPLPEDVRNCV